MTEGSDSVGDRRVVLFYIYGFYYVINNRYWKQRLMKEIEVSLAAEQYYLHIIEHYVTYYY